LTDPADSEGVLVEAATLVMRYDPTHLQEAVAYLNEARRQNAIPALRPFILGCLALALERQGRTEEARGVAREAHERVELLVSVADAPKVPLLPRVRLPRIASVEVLAMVAVLSEPAHARQYWSEFIAKAPADHPWLGHARAELGRKVE
jgi:hypothetical protein